jgi:hypothetical protein
LAKLNSDLQINWSFETTIEDKINIHYELFKPYSIAGSSIFGVFITGELFYYDSLNFQTNVEFVTIKISDLPNSISIDDQMIQNFQLSQNYPNPFNPTTIINYTISKSPSPYQGEGFFVSLKIYNLHGEEIATLINENQPPGNYQVEFDGNGLSSGVYFYRLQTGNYSVTNKMILLR